MHQKRCKRVSGEGLPGGKAVEVDDRRERECSKRMVSERRGKKGASQM